MQAVEDPCYDVYCVVQPVELCKLLKTPVMMSMVMCDQWSNLGCHLRAQLHEHVVTGADDSMDFVLPFFKINFNNN